MIKTALSTQQRLGFSIIELLIAISVMAVISTIGIASYANFSQDQIVKSASLDVESMLNTAKSRASTQVKPSDCSTLGLEKYGVAICNVAGSPGVCGISEDNYMLYVTCGGNNYPITSKKLPVGVTFDGPNISSKTINFSVLTGVITGDDGPTLPYYIRLKGYNRFKTLTIDSAGTIAITDN